MGGKELLTLNIWQLSADQPPILSSRSLLEDLCIIDESSRDLFQEFKAEVNRDRRPLFALNEVIANGRQVLVAVCTHFRDDAWHCLGVKAVYLAGINYKT